MSDEKPIFVPVALSKLEAVAVESACAFVATSSPIRLSTEHPLFSGMLKICDARKKAEAGLSEGEG